MATTIDQLSGFDPATAERLIEDLRYGVPPPDYVRSFTVGREAQLRELAYTISAPTPEGGAALLVKANYGGGKSHLLRIIREMALDTGYAVSLVVVNAQQGVRFNRMDTVFGEICRQIETDRSGSKGVGRLFDRFAKTPGATLGEELQRVRERISSSGKWDFSDYLKSPAVYVALRAWIHGGTSVRDTIEDWFSNPDNYRSQRKVLHEALVLDLRTKFRDPRKDWQFYNDDVFKFNTGGHRQAWDGLADLDLVAKAAGLRGLILLFDEFEDIIQNLNRRNLQQQALHNLFSFFAGNRYPGMAYFAVTPDFVLNCANELIYRGVLDFDYRKLVELPAFEMDEISEHEFLELAQRLRAVHSAAFEWDAQDAVPDVDLLKIVTELWSVSSPDRVRRAIQGVVRVLDERLDEVA
jgi:hypothetical protein